MSEMEALEWTAQSPYLKPFQHLRGECGMPSVRQALSLTICVASQR